MFAWLNNPSPLEKAIENKDYAKAIELVQEEIDQDPDAFETRALVQTKAELMAQMGKKAEAIEILRALMNLYSNDNMHTKAIALHKLMWDIDIRTVDKFYEDVAKKALEEIKPIDIRPIGMEAMPARVTATVAHTPLFGDLSADEVRALIQGLTLQTKSPGDILMVEGEPGDSLFILTDGRVQVHVRSASGKTTPIRVLESGCFFGEISIVQGKPRTATLTCKTACELLELDRATLSKIAESHPKVEKVLQEYCEKRSQSPEEQEGRGSA